MRVASLTLGLCLVLSGGSVEVLAQGFDHSSWDHVLKEFVNEQYIRVHANEENRRALDALNHPRLEHFEYDWGINDIHAPAVTSKSG